MRHLFYIKIVAIILLLSTSCRAMESNLLRDEKLQSFLKALQENNAKYIASKEKHFFDKFRDTQSPNVTIVKCSDSRVIQDAFDDTPENDVFTIRNIGNQLITSEGSVDYGVKVLKTPYLMIVGHSGCGAVKAANDKTKTNITAIDKELHTIKLKQGQNFNDSIVENVHNQVSAAKQKYIEMVNSGELTIIGAVYDFRNDFGRGIGQIIPVSINGSRIEINTIKAEDQKPIGRTENLLLPKP